jgi:hypothetical protein
VPLCRHSEGVEIPQIQDHLPTLGGSLGVELQSLKLPFSCRRLSQTRVNWAPPCHDICDTQGYWLVLPRYRIRNFLILSHFRCETRSCSIGIVLASFRILAGPLGGTLYEGLLGLG